MTRQATDVGWHDDNAAVQVARRPFTQRACRVLQVDGLLDFAGLPSQRRLEADIDTRAYYTYPLLFYSAFPDVSLAQLRTLSLCGSYMFDYMLTLDQQLDNNGSGDATTLFLGGLLHQEALMLLSTLLPPSTPYWRHFDNYIEQFVQATLRERLNHHGLCNPYADEELENVYAGKAAVGKASIAALAFLGDRRDLIAPMAASHDHFHVAYQLLDDLQDWRDDYRRRQYSYPLAWALGHAGWVSRAESSAPPPAEDVGRLLMESGAVEHTRARSLAYLDRARSALRVDMPDGSWAAAIDQARRLVSSFAFHHELERSDAPASHPGGKACSESVPDRSSALGRRTALDWSTALDADATAVPVAADWARWLDPTRAPHVTDARIRATQRAALLQAGGAATVGEAVCQVGMAVAASRTRHPQHPLTLHLGMPAGELAWCARNIPWAFAVLTRSVDAPARLWSANTTPRSPTGRMPVGIGRYVGLRLVDEYTQAVPTGDVTPARVLDHHTRQRIT